MAANLFKPVIGADVKRQDKTVKWGQAEIGGAKARSDKQDGDTDWDRVLADTRPRPELSKLGDKIAVQLDTNPESFPEIQEEDFDREL